MKKFSMIILISSALVGVEAGYARVVDDAGTQMNRVNSVYGPAALTGFPPGLDVAEKPAPADPETVNIGAKYQYYNPGEVLQGAVTAPTMSLKKRYNEFNELLNDVRNKLPRRLHIKAQDELRLSSYPDGSPITDLTDWVPFLTHNNPILKIEINRPTSRRFGTMELR